MVNNLKQRLLLVILLVLVGVLGGCSSNILEEFFASLEIPTEVSSDLKLLTEYEYDGKKISVVWQSTNPDILSNEGVVTLGDSEEQVILKATATLGSQTKVKNYTITIKADDTEALLEKALVVIQPLIMNQNLDKSVELATTYEVDGKTINISWQSSHPEILDHTGKVNLPYENTKVIMTVTFSYGKKTLEKEVEVSVLKDPNYHIGNHYATLDVYKGKIEGETSPLPIGRFDGAIYRKVTSSKDYWLGIEVLVTLPEFTGDPKRTSQSPYDSTAMRFNDNASVYLGGNGGAESDVGLTWSVGINPTTGNVDFSESIGFRPFWRYIHGGKNIYANAPVSHPEYYYYPGDTVRMSVYAASDGYLQLRIELVEETTIEKYVQRRNSYNLGENYSKLFISEEFPSVGVGYSKTLFKRCCALDQVNNEGGVSQPTNAKSADIIYHEVYLYREIDGTMYKVPMTSDRRSELSFPGQPNKLGDFTNAILIKYTGVDTSLGGEIVTIDPKNNK